MSIQALDPPTVQAIQIFVGKIRGALKQVYTKGVYSERVTAYLPNREGLGDKLVGTFSEAGSFDYTVAHVARSGKKTPIWTVCGDAESWKDGATYELAVDAIVNFFEEP